MSRRIIWLVAIAVAVAVTVVVYSRRNTEEGTQAAETAPAQSQQNSSTDQAKPNDDAPKTICTLNPQQAPDLRGVKLGMTVEQVLALFPGSNDDSELRAEVSRPPSPFGVASFIIRPEKYDSRDKFAGIRDLTFSVLDGQVSQFTASYTGLEFKHVDEFVTKFAEPLNLPPAESWEPYVGLDNQLKLLKCDGFEISVYAGGKSNSVNYVMMRDMVAQRKLQERRAKAREKAETAAKP